MKTLTAPQSKLISSVAKTATGAPAGNYDRRVINALVKAGLAVLDGDTVKLTEAGLAVVPVKAAKAKKEKKVRPTPASKQPGVPCYCGCGKTTKNALRTFLQGHDARLRSNYLKVTRGEASKSIVPTDREEVVRYLAKDAHWMTKKLSDAFADAK